MSETGSVQAGVRPGWAGATAVVVLILLSIPIALYAFGFQLRMAGSPEFHARFDQMPIASAMHVLGGGMVLLLGGFQFSRRLRMRMPALHRNMGRVYLILVAVGGTGGLMLAPFSEGGLVAHFGFALLGITWLYSGWQAYAAIRRGDIALHREWMMRNFSLTFAAVTLRIYLGLMGPVAGLPFEEVYPTIAWLCWVPNLIVVEWYLAWERARKTAPA